MISWCQVFFLLKQFLVILLTQFLQILAHSLSKTNSMPFFDFHLQSSSVLASIFHILLTLTIFIFQTSTYLSSVSIVRFIFAILLFEHFVHQSTILAKIYLLKQHFSFPLLRIHFYAFCRNIDLDLFSSFLLSEVSLVYHNQIDFALD